MNPREQRLKLQVEEIERVRSALGVNLDGLADRLLVKRETMRKYARGYQPASERLMHALRGLNPRMHEEPAEYRVGTRRRRANGSHAGAAHSATHLPPALDSHDQSAIAWSIIVRVLADRLGATQIAEALNQVLALHEIDESVRIAAASILGEALVPKQKP